MSTDRSRLGSPYDDYNVVVRPPEHPGIYTGTPHMTIFGVENEIDADEETYEWGPTVLLALPLGVVRAIRETLRNTPVNEMHGLDGAVIDELNNQLQQQVTYL